MRVDRVLLRRWARWVATFIGFPLAGITARVVAGNIDTATAALLGGLAGGAVLGAVQAWIGGIEADERIRWTVATAIGLAVGLSLGSALVGYDTDAASLAVMGAVSGAGVGLAQAVGVRMRLAERLLWAAATPGLWALGWVITAQVITDADRQHAVFGSSGALVVSALAGVLYAVRRQPDGRPAGVASGGIEAVAA